MFNDIGTKDSRFGMLVSDPTTGRPCKYGAVRCGAGGERALYSKRIENPCPCPHPHEGHPSAAWVILVSASMSMITVNRHVVSILLDGT